MKKEIWVIRPGALGDTVLVIPLLKSLGASGNKIRFIGNPSYFKVLKRFCPFLELLDFSSISLLPFFTEDFTIEDINIEPPAMVYLVDKSTSLFVKNFMRWQENTKVIQLEEKREKHIAEQICGKAMVLEDLVYEQRMPSRSMLFHLGSGGLHKCLLVNDWVQIIEAFLQQQKKFSYDILLGPIDKDELCPSPFRNKIIRTSTVEELMNLLEQYDRFMGVDSGVSHLAGVMGLRGHAIFHQSNPKYWRPLGTIKAVSKTDLFANLDTFFL